MSELQTKLKRMDEAHQFLNNKFINLEYEHNKLKERLTTERNYAKNTEDEKNKELRKLKA